DATVPHSATPPARRVHPSADSVHPSVMESAHPRPGGHSSHARRLIPPLPSGDPLPPLIPAVSASSPALSRTRRLGALAATCALAAPLGAVAVLGTAGPAHAAPTDVAISEVQSDGDVDWVELTNTGTEAV